MSMERVSITFSQVKILSAAYKLRDEQGFFTVKNIKESGIPNGSITGALVNLEKLGLVIKKYYGLYVLTQFAVDNLQTFRQLFDIEEAPLVGE